MNTTTMTTKAMDEVVAAVVARGPEKLSTMETLAVATELPLAELRAAVRQATERGLIRRGSGAALGVYYYAA
jgi:hypothetical protein